MFFCEIWLFDWYFPQFCTSDMSIEVRVSRSVSEVPLNFEILRVDCVILFTQTVLSQYLMPLRCTQGH